AAVPMRVSSFRLLTLSCRYGMQFGSDCNNNILWDVTRIKRGDTVGICIVLLLPECAAEGPEAVLVPLTIRCPSARGVPGSPAPDAPSEPNACGLCARRCGRVPTHWHGAHRWAGTRG